MEEEKKYLYFYVGIVCGLLLFFAGSFFLMENKYQNIKSYYDFSIGQIFELNNQIEYLNQEKANLTAEIEKLKINNNDINFEKYLQAREEKLNSDYLYALCYAGIYPHRVEYN